MNNIQQKMNSILNNKKMTELKEICRKSKCIYKGFSKHKTKKDLINFIIEKKINSQSENIVLKIEDVPKKSFSNIADNIKKREEPKDVFITPLKLAKFAIDMINTKIKESAESSIPFVWCDYCKNSGAFYNQYPENYRKEYCEILEGKDFFKYNFIKKNEDEELILCSNPPYSILDKWFQKCIDLKPKYMSFLIGNNNLTAKRMELFEDNGYDIIHLHYCKVFKWFGMSNIILLKRNDFNIQGAKWNQEITFDRVVWYEEKELIKRGKKKHKKQMKNIINDLNNFKNHFNNYKILYNLKQKINNAKNMLE